MSSPPNDQSSIVDGHSLSSFRTWLKGCDYVVINAIYSGQATPPSSHFETPAAAVSRLAQAAVRYQLLQIGICLIDGNVARPFTIDVFPADFSLSLKLLLTKTLFDCDANHMKALSDANFDFNRVFRTGMNWLSPMDEVYDYTFIFPLVLKLKHSSGIRHLYVINAGV
jgi:hypothetical protein